MESIFHEKLDEQERMRMAEGGLTSDEYRIFMQQPSENMDDSGFFSIQVISDALRVWGLELILFNSPEYQTLGIDPIHEGAFICNYKEHWFTVRKLGKQWFNLNSLLTGPELISDTYLALFLAQLQQEGYSIFVVKGDLPDCEADQLLQMVLVEQGQRPKLIGEDAAARDQRVQSIEPAVEEGRSYDRPTMMDEDEENLQKALALSRQQIDMEDEEADLRRAIQLSMQGGHRSEFTQLLTPNTPQSSGSSEPGSLTSEELRRRRQVFFEKQQQLKTEQTSDEHKAALNPDALRNVSGSKYRHCVYSLKCHSEGCQTLHEGGWKSVAQNMPSNSSLGSEYCLWSVGECSFFSHYYIFDKWLTLKAVFLTAITLARRIGELQALSCRVPPFRIHEDTIDMCTVSQFWPKLVSCESRNNYEVKQLECPLHIDVHSARAKATSWATRKQASSEDICKAGTWASPKYVHKDL
ncbi:ataxin-3 isoform X2 [Ascaphus truei]|uniref:ataxin-3 isoform X2 n=1 Tax=Ascaphus truei TaxID=8439 RepID=UPI003F5A3BFE